MIMANASSSFTPLTKERAEEIRQALARSRSSSEGVAFSETGEFEGTAPVSSSPDDRRNVIGKFDTHYDS
jgi:hypothetical protein